MARKGLPKKYAKMGFKKGWKAYKASKRKRKSPARKKTYTRRKTRAYTPKRRKRTMARRKKRGRSRGKRISLSVAAPVAILGVAAAAPILNKAMAGNMDDIGGAAQEGLDGLVAAVPAAVAAGVTLGIAKWIIGGSSIPIGRGMRIGL